MILDPPLIGVVSDNQSHAERFQRPHKALADTRTTNSMGRRVHHLPSYRTLGPRCRKPLLCHSRWCVWIHIALLNHSADCSLSRSLDSITISDLVQLTPYAESAVKSIVDGIIATTSAADLHLFAQYRPFPFYDILRSNLGPDIS